jgi:hypothetical protein
MIEGDSMKLGLIGDQSTSDSVFFFKNESIYARRRGDTINGYTSRYNTVFGVNGPSFSSNADYNTAIGYQSANDRAQHSGSVFLGAGAGYNVVGKDSILVGKKQIIINENDTIYEYNNVLNIGNDTVVNDADESVILGNNIINLNQDASSTVARKLSRNTVVGHGNINYANDSTLLGYKNINSAKASIVIGKGVRNYGSNSLLIYPKREDGSSVQFENHENGYVNIFGILTGSNDHLNIAKNVTFTESTLFESNVEVKNTIYSHCNVTSNLHVEQLFVGGSNVSDVILSVEGKTAQVDVQLDELNSRTSFISLDMSELSTRLDETNTDLNELSNVVDDNRSKISSNTTEIDNIKETQLLFEENLDDAIENAMFSQFDSIITKAIDGTYILNIDGGLRAGINSNTEAVGDLKVALEDLIITNASNISSNAFDILSLKSNTSFALDELNSNSVFNYLQLSNMIGSNENTINSNYIQLSNIIDFNKSETNFSLEQIHAKTDSNFIQLSNMIDVNDSNIASNALDILNLRDTTNVSITELHAKADSNFIQLSNMIDVNDSNIASNALDILNLRDTTNVSITELHAKADSNFIQLSNIIDVNDSNIASNALDILNLRDTTNVSITELHAKADSNFIQLSNIIDVNDSNIASNALDILNLRDTTNVSITELHTKTDSNFIQLSDMIDLNDSNIASNALDILNLRDTTNVSITELHTKTDSNFIQLSNVIDLNQFTISSNATEIDSLKIKHAEFEGHIESISTIVQKAIDDSLTTFPSFNADQSLVHYEQVNFDEGSRPILYPVRDIFGDHEEIWHRAVLHVEEEPESQHVKSIHLSNVIIDDSNVFKNDTYFLDRVRCSNNLAVNSNLFVGGVIQSFSNHVIVNDNLLIHKALHVSDFIQTNAIKADHNFNNYIKCFSNLSFSNDWKIFTSNNPNNSNLKDLVFKGTNKGSEGIETTFTDFIPGQLNFTGQHRCSFSNNFSSLSDYMGYIVCSTGKYSDLDDEDSINIDDAIPIVALSEKAYDQTVFGVISGDEDSAYPNDDNRRCFQIGTVKFKTSTQKKSTKAIVNSVGEGCIWVCDQGGDIYNGDLIVTSDSPGLGMRQNDDVIHNYTVAKATCDAIFDGDSKKFIGCTYKF